MSHTPVSESSSQLTASPVLFSQTMTSTKPKNQSTPNPSSSPSLSSGQQPTASASGSLTPSTQFRTPVKMYSPIPIPAKDFGPSPGKKAKKCASELQSQLDSCQTVLSSKFSNIDTHIKSALYSVSQNNVKEVKETLEKTRSLLNAALCKNGCMLQDVTKQFESEMEVQFKKNDDIQKELDETKEKLNLFTSDYAMDMFDDSDKEEENTTE